MALQIVLDCAEKENGRIAGKIAMTTKFMLTPVHLNRIAQMKAYYMKNKARQLGSEYCKRHWEDSIYVSQAGLIEEFVKNPGPLLQWPSADEANHWERYVDILLSWQREDDEPWLFCSQESEIYNEWLQRQEEMEEEMEWNDGPESPEFISALDEAEDEFQRDCAMEPEWPQ